MTSSSTFVVAASYLAGSYHSSGIAFARASNVPSSLRTVPRPRCLRAYQLRFRFILDHTFSLSHTNFAKHVAMTIHDQMAIQMADLGVDTRDTVYAPDADAAGNERFTTPAAQAAVANAERKHRSQAMASGDARTQGWNSEHLPSLHALKSHY